MDSYTKNKLLPEMKQKWNPAPCRRLKPTTTYNCNYHCKCRIKLLGNSQKNMFVGFRKTLLFGGAISLKKNNIRLGKFTQNIALQQHKQTSVCRGIANKENALSRISQKRHLFFWKLQKQHLCFGKFVKTNNMLSGNFTERHMFLLEISPTHCFWNFAKTSISF